MLRVHLGIIPKYVVIKTKRETVYLPSSYGSGKCFITSGVCYTAMIENE